MIQASKFCASLFKESNSPRSSTIKRKRQSLPIHNEHQNTITEHMTILMHKYTTMQNITKSTQAKRLKIIEILQVNDRFTLVNATNSSEIIRLIIPSTLLNTKKYSIILKKDLLLLVDASNYIQFDDFSIISNVKPFKYIDDNTIT